MAKLNEKTVRIGTIKKELNKLHKEAIEQISLTYGRIRGHRKYVHISTKDTRLDLELTHNEFGEVAYKLDYLNGEKLDYLI